jgi:stage V sporulation protein SpoVS
MLPLFSFYLSMKALGASCIARARKSAAQLRGYQAVSELHCKNSFTDRSIPEEKTIGRMPALAIVSNSSDKVLSDLARSLQPSESGPCLLPWLERYLRRYALFADSEFADDFAIAVCVALFQVVKQATTLTHQHEKSPA